MAKQKTTTRREGLPTFWVTQLAKALSADQPCELAPWLNAHFNLAKLPRENSTDLALWKVNHTELLNDLVVRMKAQGWKVDKERFLSAPGSTAVINGKADLVCQQANKRPLIVDVKGGEPRESDLIQVMLEMIFLPYAWNAPTMIFDGRVVYVDHSVDISPNDADRLRPKAFALIKRLALSHRPDASPGLSACRFCDVGPSDCPDRWTKAEEPQPALVESL